MFVGWSADVCRLLHLPRTSERCSRYVGCCLNWSWFVVTECALSAPRTPRETKKGVATPCNVLFFLMGRQGFEPRTKGLWVLRANLFPFVPDCAGVYRNRYLWSIFMVLVHPGFALFVPPEWHESGTKTVPASSPPGYRPQLPRFGYFVCPTPSTSANPNRQSIRGPGLRLEGQPVGPTEGFSSARGVGRLLVARPKSPAPEFGNTRSSQSSSNKPISAL